MPNKKEDKEVKHYIGRMRETDLKHRTGKPLTEAEVAHNLDQLLKFHNREKLVRKCNNADKQNPQH